MKRYAIVIPLIVLISSALLPAAQDTTSSARIELLWPDGAPGAKGDADGDKPSLTVYLPDKTNAVGTAVVICPGGGYYFLGLDTAHKAAEWFNSLGVAAFVLKYRHSGTGYTHPAPLQDAQRAVRLVRSNAKKWNIDAEKIGIMGLSAGGHLAATLGTHFDRGKIDAEDSVERFSCRPDFMILVYPLITLTEPYTHQRAKLSLLGPNPDSSLVVDLSIEKQVKITTPPAFIVHGSDDTVVPVENSIMFYQALQKADVPVEMHIYQNGEHGFGLGTGRGATGPVTTWTDRLLDWMKYRGLLNKKI
jgi:acetyl esterase/lipase